MGSDQIGRIVEQTAIQFPDRVALKTTDGLSRSYAEFDTRSTRLANALLGAGYEPGDRIAAWMETCPQYLELYVAVAKAGLVLVPVNSMFTEYEAAFQIEDSGAKALFHAESLTAAAESLSAKVGLRDLFVVGDWRDEDSQFEVFLRSGGVDMPPYPDENALYLLSYTSGTTGRPKGAMVTHRSLKNTLRQHAHSYRTPQGSVCIYHANMSFVATVLALIMGHLYVRGTIVMTKKRSTPAEVMDVIEAEKGTFSFLPSPWVAPMTELAKKYPHKWQSIRTFVHSASKANPEDLRRWAEVVGHRYLEGWGMTEASGSLFTTTDVDDVLVGSKADDFFASTGRPALDVVVRVIGEDGQELPHDGESIGELVVQSPTLVVGYWNNEQATTSSFRDGWFHTGDLGSLDAAGYVYVTERRTDLIVSGGMNVYPSEIEHSICEIEDVLEVAVIGVPHERWGETPIALVVLAEDAAVTTEDVLEHCATYLARYKKPSAVHFIPELPRNASQKVLKRVLREQYGQAPR